MRRLAAIDWLLIGTLLPICLFGVVMSVVHGVRGDFVRLPFAASSAPDGQAYPIVRRVISSPSAEAGSVAVGDRVLRPRLASQVRPSNCGSLPRGQDERVCRETAPGRVGAARHLRVRMPIVQVPT